MTGSQSLSVQHLPGSWQGGCALSEVAPKLHWPQQACTPQLGSYAVSQTHRLHLLGLLLHLLCYSPSLQASTRQIRPCPLCHPPAPGTSCTKTQPQAPFPRLLCQGWHNSPAPRHVSINSACEGKGCHCLLLLPAGRLHLLRGAPSAPITATRGGALQLGGSSQERMSLL